MSSNTCRSCGAKVKWIQLESGKWNPVDPELISSADCEHGDIMVTEDGEVRKIDHSENDYEVFDGYVSHFSTCPEADKWRKKS